MRDRNRSRLLRLIYQRGPISRAALARLSGLTKGAISGIVQELLGQGLVREEATPSQGLGRPPVLLRVATDRLLVGAVNVQRRRTHLAVATLDGALVTQEWLATEAPLAALLERALARLDALLRDPLAAPVAGVAVTAPGLSIVDAGDPEGARLRVGEESAPVEPLRAACEWPVVFLNDGQAAALADHLVGGARSRGSLCTLLLDDEVSGGLVLDGRLTGAGADRMAASFGHIIVDPAGEPCTCGRTGCLQALVSPRAVVRRYRAALLETFSSAEPVSEPEPKVVSDSGAVRLSWDPAGRLPAVYDVYRARQGGAGEQLEHLGTTAESFLWDEPLGEGPFAYAVAATDLFGRQSGAAALQPGRPGIPRTLFRDLFPGSTLDEYRTMGPLSFLIGTDGLALSTPEEPAPPALLWKEVGTGVDAVVRFRPDARRARDAFGIAVRVVDGEWFYAAAVAYGTDEGLGPSLVLLRHTAAGPERLAVRPVELEIGRAYHLRVRESAGRLRAKLWASGAHEPAAWELNLHDEVEWSHRGVGLFCRASQVTLVELAAQARPMGREAEADSASPPGGRDDEHRFLELVVEQARRGDRVARRVLEETGRHLGTALVNVREVTGIRRIRIGGALARGWPFLESGVQSVWGTAAGEGPAQASVAPGVTARRGVIAGAVFAAALPLIAAEP